MFTWMLIFVAVCILALFWMNKQINKGNKKAFWLTIIFIFVMAIILVLVPIITQFNAVVQNAEQVASYADARIFYDSVADEYFAVSQNFWKPIDGFERHELNQQIAKQLVEDYVKAQEVPFIEILSTGK